MEVRCCCKPENVLGDLPAGSLALPKRELSDGSIAYSADEKPVAELLRIPGFLHAPVMGKKTWKSKTWRKSAA